MLESLNYSFRNPKNIIWVTYRIKQLRNYKKNHGVLRGPQLGKQRWWARLGILRVKDVPVFCHTLLSPSSLHFTHPPLLPIHQSTSHFHFIHSEHCDCSVQWYTATDSTHATEPWTYTEQSTLPIYILRLTCGPAVLARQRHTGKSSRNGMSRNPPPHNITTTQSNNKAKYLLRNAAS